MNPDAFNQKRRNVPEEPAPEGEVKGTQDALVFVVQKHQASRLHYDVRLELDGVLKS
jgi:bifunctional non-homologous end joining protein LigD